MAKGGAFERKLCKRLSQWWLGSPTADVVFWRTSGSGARATIRSKTNKQTTRAHCGDVGAIDVVGLPLTNLITWEGKNGYPDAEFFKLVGALPKKGLEPYEQWIGQAIEASRAAGTPYWAIVHHKHAHHWMMTMPLTLWDRLGCCPAIIGGPIVRMCLPQRWTSEVLPRLEVVSVRFEEFLKGITPADIRYIYRERKRG